MTALPNPSNDRLAASPGAAALAVGRFGRRDRIILQREFRAVLHQGRRGRSPHLQATLLQRATDDGPPARLGLSVSKQVGHAPARARMRRLLREAFRALRGHLSGPLDVVVLAKTPWPDAGLADVMFELSKIFDYLQSDAGRRRGPRSPQRSR